jgi:biuret amidohydrolase
MPRWLASSTGYLRRRTVREDTMPTFRIPRTLEEAVDPQQMALLVYDMQAGIVRQLPDGARVVERVQRVLSAARDAGMRVFFTRHMSLPQELMGVSQYRMAIPW